jgi:hypothetical protein
MKPVSIGALAALLALALAAPAAAQEPKSTVLAKQLVAALDAAKSDSIAAKDASIPDTYIGALYIPGFELLVIAGKYSAPTLLDARLEKKEYKDIYSELNGTIAPDTKVFIEDIGADGVRARKSDNVGFDSAELSGKQTTFDENWKRQNISEDDYMKAHAAADERYAQILTALLAQAKK